MIDWTQSMQQSFEYYIVDPNTWGDVQKLDTVKSSKIDRDSTAETLGSASIDVVNELGECYIRIYLIAIQNDYKEKVPLGTFLVQTPSSSFNGKTRSTSMDAYTPLMELKENQPPIGYSLLEDDNIMENVYKVTRDNVRAPVVKAESSDTLNSDFVADTSETWLSFLTDLMANANYKFELDEIGRILFAPEQETASLQPVWTYNDDNSSILLPDLDMEHDLYGVPNVVEIVYSSGRDYFHARAVNDDPNSPTSTINRGREIVYREINPSSLGSPTEKMLQEYAEKILKEQSSIEYTITYTHGYCPVRLGDCVRLNYTKAGLKNIKAKVVNQQIDCKPGCQVTEKAVFTTKLWR
jgi:hypothetical protein